VAPVQVIFSGLKDPFLTLYKNSSKIKMSLNTTRDELIRAYEVVLSPTSTAQQRKDAEQV